MLTKHTTSLEQSRVGRAARERETSVVGDWVQGTLERILSHSSLDYGRRGVPVVVGGGLSGRRARGKDPGCSSPSFAPFLALMTAAGESSRESVRRGLRVQ